MALALLAAQLQPAADTTSERVALYGAAAMVLVALIGGVVAIVNNRRPPVAPPPEHPQIRYVDPPTSHSLSRELVDLLAEVTADRDQWRDRALAAGWQPEETCP